VLAGRERIREELTETQPASPQWQMTAARGLARAQAQGLARGHGHDDAEAARAELGAAGHERHVPGDVEAAAEGVDDPRFGKEPSAARPSSSRCSCGRARW